MHPSATTPLPPPEEREETYEAVISEAWRSYDSGEGMDSARHRALKLALEAMAARDQDARDRVRLKVSENVRDLISFSPTGEAPAPCPAPWKASDAPAQAAGATVHPIH